MGKVYRKANGMITEYPLETLIDPLCDWFCQNARELPWRSDPTPYHVWISEIMLQQTRVEAVRPYYARFMDALPDIYALAACPEEKYMKLWEGLGYYSRVRNLHEAAVTVVEQYNGIIPADYSELLKLKGIGHYTAGAISSIAYGKPAAAVDGNVLRILTRVAGDDTDIMKQSFRNQVEKKITDTLYETTRNPGMVNQALMELGATVCLPNGQPHCDECPWHANCKARLMGCIDLLPVKKKAKERRIEKRTVLLIYEENRIAIHKREDKGLLAGLYELPNVSGHLTDERLLSYIKQLGYTTSHIRPLSAARHIFSHVEWHMIGYQITLENKQKPDHTEVQTDLLFVDTSSVKRNYTIPSAFSAYLAYIDTNIERNFD